MVTQIRIAWLALPAACIDMSDPQTALPGQRWNLEHINHMKDSTIKLIQHSMTTKITPTIERFAQAAIDKIDNDVIPGLASEHKAAVDLLDQEYQKFHDITTNIDAVRSNLASKDEECSKESTEHEHCRTEEHTIVTEVTECEERHDTCTSEWTTCEDTIKFVEDDMENIWCEQAFDALSRDFFRRSKGTMKEYIQHKRECTTKRNECEEHAPTCETKTQERTETRTRCDTEQVHVEQCTCERANLVEHWTEHFTLEWRNLTSTYEEMIKQSEELESEAIKEFEGLHVVKCLLEKIIVIGQTDGPCNESHVEQVAQEISACYTEQHDSSHLRRPTPNPSPHFPKLYEHNPYPCSPEFIKQYYSHLPEDAGAKECDSHYCSTRLFDDEGRPLVYR